MGRFDSTTQYSTHHHQHAFPYFTLGQREVDPTSVYVGDGPQKSGSGTFRGTALGVSSLNLYNNGDFVTKRLIQFDTSIEPAQQYVSGAAYVFADTVFKNNRDDDGFFTDENIGGSSAFVPLSATTGNFITPDHVENALSNVIAHEIGHNLGLRHLIRTASESVMNQNPLTPNSIPETDFDELRRIQVFKDEPITQGDIFPSFFLENSAGRLAFAAGSDDSDDSITRENPDFVVPVGSERRENFIAELVSNENNLSLASSAMGFLDRIESDAIPDVVSLGSGDLDAVLDRAISYGHDALHWRVRQHLFCWLNLRH